MPLRSRFLPALLSLILVLAAGALGQATPDTQTPPAAQVPADKAQAPADKKKPGEQQPQGQGPEGTQNGIPVFRKRVDEVVLHATVVDDKRRMVTNLDRGAFQIFEDGQPQTLVSFRHEDIPVALGVVIDNSGSMREKRPSVNQAALNLVRASNRQDQVFIVNFNDDYYLDQDFTNDVPKLREALEKIEARGGTALYDAVVASAEHLAKYAKLEKKVLLVVTDGEDNASKESLEQAIRTLQAERGPVVYCIGILGDEHTRRAKRALNAMADQTGGIAYFPKNLTEVDAISQEVAHDIRNQYTLGYRPSKPQSVGGYRTIRVDAKASGYKHMSVRTRTGYYAGQTRSDEPVPPPQQ